MLWVFLCIFTKSAGYSFRFSNMDSNEIWSGIYYASHVDFEWGALMLTQLSSFFGVHSRLSSRFFVCACEEQTGCNMLIFKMLNIVGEIISSSIPV